MAEPPTERYFDLSAADQAELLQSLAPLIHVECHRPNLRPSAERLSRHWYDLARLADHEVGHQALQDTDLLCDVLSIKETFYRSGFSHYERCLSGGLRLVPDTPMLEALPLVSIDWVVTDPDGRLLLGRAVLLGALYLGVVISKRRLGLRPSGP